MRVEEQLAALEQYLGRPEEGYKCLAYFQLRAVWRAAATPARAVLGASSPASRRTASASCSSRTFERTQARDGSPTSIASSSRRACSPTSCRPSRSLAEQRMREPQRLLELLPPPQALREAIEARSFRIDAALTQVTDLGDRRHAIESEPPPVFEGMSLEGRRAVNLAVIAYAESLRERLSAGGPRGPRAADARCAACLRDPATAGARSASR